MVWDAGLLQLDMTNKTVVDVCIQTPMKGLDSMHQLAEVLANSMSLP